MINNIDQKQNKKKHRHAVRGKTVRLAALLLAASLLTGCTMPSGGGWDVLRAFGDFLNPSKSSEEIFSSDDDDTTGEASGDVSGDDDEADASASDETTGSDGDTYNEFHFSLDELAGDDEYSDYVADGESLFVNNASYFYYYNQISTEEQALYDALWDVVQDPTSTDYRKGIEVSIDPASDEFATEIARAYEALIYDHPELFWFRQSGGNFKYYYSLSGTVTGSYTVMVQLSDAYENYETEMTAFNQAVNAFLSDIDLSQSQAVVALQIHDKLIDLVDYDDDLANQLQLSDNSYDYGYSAYGALVANSRGDANTAVCDGYSYAYEYLLQQAGITATRVGGYAGTDTGSLQAHSWNLVCLDGEWYEVDPTWDDQDPSNDSGSAIVAAAVSDTAYWSRIRHFMFNLTTDTITNYSPDDSYTYYTDSGYVSFLTSSIHIRNTESDSASTQDYLSYLAPTATGTTYTYDSLAAYSTTGTYSSGSDTESSTNTSIVAEGELVPYDADGDGAADNPAYQDLDGDGWVDW